MVRIALLFALALFSTASDRVAASPTTEEVPLTSTTDDPAETKKSSSAKPWILAGVFAAFVFLLVIKNICWPTETRPMTPQEIKETQERLLDSYSKLQMWQAVARNDGDALREEMKLMELRRLRRLNE
jgi:hypothetical protein